MSRKHQWQTVTERERGAGNLIPTQIAHEIENGIFNLSDADRARLVRCIEDRNWPAVGLLIGFGLDNAVAFAERRTTNPAPNSPAV